VHPENYELVEQIANKAGLPVQQLIGNTAALKGLNTEEFLSEKVGKHTLEDILSELEKPSRDPRKEFKYAKFDDKVQHIQDLVTGSWIEGVVTNVTNFGAFVDIGVHQDGLVHISEMSDQFVKDAKTVLTLGDVVKVRVMAVDVGQKRISLSMKQETNENTEAGSRGQRPQRGPGGYGARGGDRGGAPGAQGGSRAPAKPPVQAHATLADLKAKLAGNTPGQKQAPKPVQIGKVNSMLKQIMKGGR
jgi:protein Tex